MVHRSHLWITALSIALTLTSPAHADWTLARADAPVAVVRGANVSAAHAGDRLRDGDLLESGDGVVHLQDEHGTLAALGPQTRAMLTADAHVALLRGWLKIAAAACAPPSCATTPVTPRVDTERGAIDIGANAAAIVATRDDAIDIFSETGAQSFAAKPPATIADGRFASIDARARLQRSARPPDAFIAAMPVPFRDALQPLARPVPPASTTPSRAVTYDDIAPWLVSTLPARKTFPARFRSRLADAAFRRDIGTHLKALPDWRALLYPPTRSGVRRARYP
ncbi:hypothetical protein [Caballeronia sp. INDeC2]|uniref:hypothetical protein n=1 Tax=Caballeronia sp. INDeC2 TaxID=2921747 RepID=UPI002028C9C3|nr:hypothetical protein [Caballeronia sp. INDeC2]